MKLSFRLLLIMVLCCVANAYARPPIVSALKSAVLPGLGELSLGDRSGYFFLASEVALWSSRLYFQQESDLLIRKSHQFAYNQANLRSFNDMDEHLWFLMSRYNSSGFDVGGYNESVVIAAIERYRDNPAEMTRYINENKLPDDIYWDWETRDNRRQYQHMRRDSGHFDDYAKAVGGIIIVNHIISFLNTIRIANSQNPANVQFYADVDRDMTRWMNFRVGF